MTYSNYMTKQDKMNQSCFLVEIEEQYLFDKTVEQLKLKLNPDFLSFNYWKYDIKEHITEDLLNALTTYPFFDEKRIVVVEKSNSLLEKEEDFQKILNYLKSPNTSTLLLLADTEELKGRKKLEKALGNKESYQKIKKMNPPEYKNWISDFFSERQIRINGRILEHIVARSHYLDKYDDISLYHIENQLFKLLPYGMKLEASTVDLYFDEPEEYNIFKMMDAVLEGRKKDAYRYLEVLERKNTPRRQIYGMLSKQYRNLFHMKLMQAENSGAEEIAATFRELEGRALHPFVIQKLVGMSKKMEMKELKKLQMQLLDMDFRMKSGRMDGDLALDLLIL